MNALMHSMPTLDSLYGLFPDASGLPASRTLAPNEIPQPYRSLLVHTHHMTVTVERFYESPVDVRVLESRHIGNEYARKILLSLSTSGRVVQFGIVQIDVDRLAQPVREEILAGQTPLGRVLIRHDVFRRIRSAGYVVVTPTVEMQHWFGMSGPEPLYGRLGIIDTDDRPAIAVLEILAPIPNTDAVTSS